MVLRSFEKRRKIKNERSVLWIFSAKKMKKEHASLPRWGGGNGAYRPRFQTGFLVKPHRISVGIPPHCCLSGRQYDGKCGCVSSPKASVHGADRQQSSRKNFRSTPRMNQKSPQVRGGRRSFTSFQPRLSSPFFIESVNANRERVNRYVIKL